MNFCLSRAVPMAAVAALFTAPTWAQDLGPHFKKLKDGIFVYAQKPADSNATIILTSEGVVLIDSGHRLPDTVALAHAVKKLTSQPVRYLINTEPHTDHTTGHWLFSPPALIIAHAEADDWQGKDRFPSNIEAAYRTVTGKSQCLGECCALFLKLVFQDVRKDLPVVA